MKFKAEWDSHSGRVFVNEWTNLKNIYWAHIMHQNPGKSKSSSTHATILLGNQRNLWITEDIGSKTFVSRSPTHTKSEALSWLNLWLWNLSGIMFWNHNFQISADNSDVPSTLGSTVFLHLITSLHSWEMDKYWTVNVKSLAD